MKRAAFNLLFAVLVGCIGLAAQTPKSNQKKMPTPAQEVFRNLDTRLVPLFAYTSFDPYRTPYGSDSADFVLYEDGTMIFTRCPERDNRYSCIYVKAKLSSVEIFEMLKKLNSASFYSFAENYSPDTSKIVVNHLGHRRFVMRKSDGTYKKIDTDGWLSGDKPGYIAEGVPSALKEVYRFIADYDNPTRHGV